MLARAAHRGRAQLDPAAAVDLKLLRARAAAAEPMLAPLQPIQQLASAQKSDVARQRRSSTVSGGGGAGGWQRQRNRLHHVPAPHTARASGSQTDSIFLSG